MIKSMTGYGSAKGSAGDTDISIELRSVNNRYLDCNIRMPRVYTAAEDAMKALIQSFITRGKADVYVTVDSSKTGDVSIVVNKPLADAYMAALKSLSDGFEIENDVKTMSLARFPDVLQVEKKETDMESISAGLCNVLGDALLDFNAMRIREGEKLFADISARIDSIENLTLLAEERSPVVAAEYRAKLEKRMAEVLQNREIDESRLLTEAAIFADRIAVNEEIVRLRSHISQLREILQSAEPVGRKLDFLIQEVNREANTIGSKGNDIEMAKIVVELKAEIEKIREQVQNIE